MSFGKYQPDNKGMAAFVTSQMVGDAMASVAADMASQARSIGRSDYASRGRIVQGGYRASDRAGAEVYETERHWGDVTKRRLVNLSNTYRMRGGG